MKLKKKKRGRPRKEEIEKKLELLEEKEIYEETLLEDIKDFSELYISNCIYKENQLKLDYLYNLIEDYN